MAVFAADSGPIVRYAAEMALGATVLGVVRQSTNKRLCVQRAGPCPL